MKRDPMVKPKVWDYAFLLTRKIKKDLQTTLPTTHGRWLDIGCGSQPHRSYYPTSAQIIGFDVNSKLPHLHFLAEADHIPIRSETCDVALFLAVLQCVNNPIQSVQEAARVLKPGGILLMLEHQGWQMYSAYDRFRFTQSGLVHLGKEAGLKLISIRPQGSFWTRIGCRINRALLPYSNSTFSSLAFIFFPITIFNNLLFGLLDDYFSWDGEAVSHLAVFNKETIL